MNKSTYIYIYICMGLIGEETILYQMAPNFPQTSEIVLYYNHYID